MIHLFKDSQVYDGDIYIADYTNNPDHPGRGVEISSSPHSINSFHLQLLKKFHFLAVNIEEYPAFKKDIKNCEAVVASLKPEADQKGWVLFIELKYCSERRIDDYGPVTIDQMDAVRKKLTDMQLIDTDRHIIHFNYCSPNNAESEPFDGFKETQNATLHRVESEGVIFHARMSLIAIDGTTLIEPSTSI